MFIYSLPILLNYIQWGTTIEFLSIILLVTVSLYISSPVDPFADDKEWGNLFSISFYQYLLYAWMGQLKLWMVFWPFFLILNICLYLTDWLATHGHFTVSSWDEVHFILATPVICWTLMVWRNSINTRLRFNAAMARLMTLTVFFEFGLKLLIRKDYPRIFFACQDILLDYASCF